jgi:3-oxoadipate enol-lactonase
VLMSSVPEATYRRALQAIAGFNRHELLGDLRLPVLCLAGEHDRNAPPKVMRQMAARIVGAEYQCLPCVGHLANMEAPGPFNQALVDFLTRRF